MTLLCSSMWEFKSLLGPQSFRSIEQCRKDLLVTHGSNLPDREAKQNHLAQRELPGPTVYLFSLTSLS